MFINLVSFIENLGGNMLDWSAYLKKIRERAKKDIETRCIEIETHHPRNYGIIIYRFFQGVSAILTVCTFALPYLTMFGLSLTLTAIILSCLVLGLIMVIHAIRTENFAANELKLIERETACNRAEKVLHKELMCKYQEELKKEPHVMPDLVNEIALQRGKSARYHDPFTFFYHLYRGGYLFGWAAGLTYGVVHFFAKALLLAHTLPIWGMLAIAVFVGLIAVYCEYIKERNYLSTQHKLSCERDRQGAKLESYRQAHAHLYTSYKRGVEQVPHVEQELKLLPAPPKRPYRTQFFKQMKAQMRNEMKQYYLQQQLELIRRKCYDYLYQAGVVDLAKCYGHGEHANQDPIAQFTRWRRKNIVTAREILRLVHETVPVDYLACVYEVQEMIVAARYHSCYGNSLLADMLDPVVYDTLHNKFNFQDPRQIERGESASDLLLKPL